MIDFLLGLFFASLFVRGWLRGFVREAMDLVGMLAGIALAFRLAPGAGAVVAGLTGAGSELSQLIGGVVVFLVVGLAAAVGAHYLQRVVAMPGLQLGNRLGGAGLALAWGLFLATMLLSLLIVVPMPPALANQLEGSVVAQALTSSTSPSQRVFQAVSGDRIVESLLNLRQVVGGRRVILEEHDSIAFPAVESSELRSDPEAGRAVFELANQARREAGLEPLEWSDGLAAVGEAHAWEMYTGGYFSHDSPVTGDPHDRVEAARIPFRSTGENLALAGTAETAHEGLMSSPGHRENILRPQFRRLGVGVVSGPLGLMVVQVFTG